MTTPNRHAVVLLSGGLDSATTLAIANRDGFACHALSFDYGQRHAVELDAAMRVASSLGVVEHKVFRIDLRAMGGSALTDDTIDVPKGAGSVAGAVGRGEPSPPAPLTEGEGSDGIPVTYVPARNTVFLSCALAYTEVIDAHDIFIGVNAVDYSGYPDCRPEFIASFEQTANLATKVGVEATSDAERIRIHAPLIHLTKAEIIRTGTELGVDYGLTISCYDPEKRGIACGACDACRLRAAGFRIAGLRDPGAPAG